MKEHLSSTRECIPLNVFLLVLLALYFRSQSCGAEIPHPRSPASEIGRIFPFLTSLEPPVELGHPKVFPYFFRPLVLTEQSADEGSSVPSQQGILSLSYQRDVLIIGIFLHDPPSVLRPSPHQFSPMIHGKRIPKNIYRFSSFLLFFLLYGFCRGPQAHCFSCGGFDFSAVFRALLTGMNAVPFCRICLGAFFFYFFTGAFYSPSVPLILRRSYSILRVRYLLANSPPFSFSGRPRFMLIPFRPGFI